MARTKYPDSHNPKLTVGILTKNSEGTIEECLASVLASNFEKPQMEIIIVDGGSTDGTLNIVEKLLCNSGLNYRIFVSKNSLAYCRQLIVANSRAKYICWIDSDSFIHRNFLKSQLEFIERNPSLGIVFPLILPKNQKPIARMQGYVWLMHTLTAVKKKKTPFLSILGTITPVKALQNIGGFNLSIKGAGEDIDLIHRLRLKGYGFAVNTEALIYHKMKESLREIWEQLLWWSSSRSKMTVRVALKEALFRFMIFAKLTLQALLKFRDIACLLIPLYGMLWNIATMRLIFKHG